jgi:hypothetical protein
VIRWGNDDGDAEYIIIVVLLPACSKSLWEMVSLFPIEKSHFDRGIFKQPFLNPRRDLIS